MARKIYDIKPPKVSKKTEKDLKEFLSKGNSGKVATRIKKQPARMTKVSSAREKKAPSIWKPLSIGIALCLFLVCVYLFFALPRVTVTIWPKVSTLSFQQTVTADKSASSVDQTNEVIPAQYFEASKTDSQDFPATGNGSNVGQATGTITVYNKCDPPEVVTLTCRNGSCTHFLSDSGKLFVASGTVTVPAAKKSGSKITPGSVTVKVQAVDGGDSYNIAPANFSVPGLNHTTYFYCVYGVSNVAMTGGYTGKIKKVTDDDIQSAQDAMTKKATDDATAALKSQISSDYVLLDNAISTSTTNASTQTKSGTVVDNFTYQATVKASALAFKKSDVDAFAKNYLLSQLPAGTTLLDGSYKIDYSASSVDISGGKMTLAINFSSGDYEGIDKNALSLSLTGKNESQIRQTINNNMGDGVSNLQVKFWPFWVSSAPNSQKAVIIQVKFQ